MVAFVDKACIRGMILSVLLPKCGNVIFLHVNCGCFSLLSLRCDCYVQIVTFHTSTKALDYHTNNFAEL